MKKTNGSKLQLRTQTIRELTPQSLRDVAAGSGNCLGWIRPPITVSCPQPSQNSCHCPFEDD